MSCLKSEPSCVTVLDRNRILFHCVFRAHHRVRRAKALSFHLGRGSYALRGRIRYSCIYTARMSPTLSRSSALQCVKLGDALKIRNGTIFDFYSGLPRVFLLLLFSDLLERTCEVTTTCTSGLCGSVRAQFSLGPRLLTSLYSNLERTTTRFF